MNPVAGCNKHRAAKKSGKFPSYGQLLKDFCLFPQTLHADGGIVDLPSNRT
jgi:hypothetical protein